MFILDDIYRTKHEFKDLPAVKKILNGGGSLSDKLTKDAIKIFPRSKLITAYGMTEACSSLTFMTLHDPTKEMIEQKFELAIDRKFNRFYQPEGLCVGKPAPHVELKISIDDSSRIGQILTRGPHLMLGYWGEIPVSTFNCGDQGWHETGDIGHIDDHGSLWLIGRMKGRMKSGGENIYPEEVETVLLKHPGISAIAVIGLPDSRLTEMVVACIQLNDNWTWANHSAKEENQCISSDTLQQYCRDNKLTGFKIPKAFIRWKKQFPVTASGKLRRDRLKAEVMDHMQMLHSSL